MVDRLRVGWISRRSFCNLLAYLCALKMTKLYFASKACLPTFPAVLYQRTNSKSTNTNECLNFESLCPERYKTSVIINFLNRAYSICSSWELFNTEINRIKQILINNNFPNYVVDRNIAKFLNNKMNKNVHKNNGDNSRVNATTVSENDTKIIEVNIQAGNNEDNIKHDDLNIKNTPATSENDTKIIEVKKLEIITKKISKYTSEVK